MTKPSDLDWSPKEESKIKEKTSKLTPPSPQYLRRSDSFSSENSLTSQSTITQYQRYGMTPLVYPSESTSTSSRSHSRLSNYSASSFASSSTASGIPHRATNSTNNNNNNTSSNNNNNNHHHQQTHHTIVKTPSSTNIGIPTPSRSYTYRDNKSQHLAAPNQRATPLAKRASHIPAPQSGSKILPPSPQRTSSSSSARSTGLPTARRTMTPTTGNRLQQRSSHIPSVRGGESDGGRRLFLSAAKEDSTSRPTSPLFNNGRSASRLGVTSSNSSSKKSLFQDRPRSTTPNTNRTTGIPTGAPSGIPHRTEEKRVMSPTGTRPSGIRPPGASGLRAPSRIGTLKKT
ncbi:hypothetical protein K501DRAFT_3845 [Backusella circina FSU 941]|nr:hypothetical protein K501DRAFT_3845 [Backusella circina FSU 941]